MILKARGALILAALLMLAGPCLAGEYAVLANGFRIYAERHDPAGSMVRLHANGGVTELPASQVTGFEAEERMPEPPASQSESKPEPQPTTREMITDAARRSGLPPELVHGVVAAESAYRANAVSRKGAMGLMQLMPSTARSYGADPADPKQNVAAGTQYLRELLLKYNGHVTRALAAYNAGPGAVDRYHGVPPYRETRAYVARVIRQYQKAQP